MNGVNNLGLFRRFCLEYLHLSGVNSDALRRKFVRSANSETLFRKSGEMGADLGMQGILIRGGMSELTTRATSPVILYTTGDGKVTADDAVVSILETTADSNLRLAGYLKGEGKP
ncbi:MAG: hypothetical protein K2P57_12320 [Burkholderiales bacterium]|nr:hypothetical protein [Burkholderiales bacterium]